MSTRLNPRQEAFAQLYVELGNASEAYRRAGYKAKTDRAVESGASEILRNPEVSKLIAEIRAALAERNEVTVDSIITELEEARQRAMTQDPTSTAAVSASMGKAKIAGLITDRSKIQAEVMMGDLPPLSPEAALAIKEKLEREKF